MRTLTQDWTGVSAEGRGSQGEAGSLGRVVLRHRPSTHHQWAWDNYKPLVASLGRELGLRRLCEIGGGRNPLFSPAEIAAFGATLTINDINQGELDYAPKGYETACFDICDDPAKLGIAPSQYDLMFSKMVFEHLPDVERAWRNVHTLLRPSGVALAFFPTLYAPPFVLNHILPEEFSSRMIEAVFSKRGQSQGKLPKFPALYDWCYSDPRKLEPMLARAGFTDTHILPFWGHDYFRRFPLIRNIDDALTAVASRRDWRAFTTYAFVLVRK